MSDHLSTVHSQTIEISEGGVESLNQTIDVGTKAEIFLLRTDLNCWTGASSILNLWNIVKLTPTVGFSEDT